MPAAVRGVLVDALQSDVEHPGTGVFNWHDGLHFFMHGCRDDPMPYVHASPTHPSDDPCRAGNDLIAMERRYIGLQSEWFVSMEDAVPALEGQYSKFHLQLDSISVCYKRD